MVRREIKGEKEEGMTGVERARFVGMGVCYDVCSSIDQWSLRYLFIGK